MNICHVTYSFYEQDNRIRRYAEALAREGHRVDVVALQKEGLPPQGTLNGVNIFRIQKRSYNEKGLGDFVKRVVSFFVKGSFFLAKKSFAERYHVLHVHNMPDLLVFMGLIPKLRGARIILDIHDALPEFYSQKFGKTTDSALSKLLLSIERLSVRFADHVIAANHIWHEKLLSRDGLSRERCTVVLNYPDLELFRKVRQKTQNGRFDILYPGTVSHHHGVDIAIRALAYLKASVPAASLNIYVMSTNQRYLDSLKALRDELGLTGAVRFFDPVPAEELWKPYSEADVGVVPKRRGVFSDEAFSSKILEFMAAGVPIAASRTPIDEYYFDDSMILFFEAEDAEGLARCLQGLYEDPLRREQLSKAGRAYADTLRWEQKRKDYVRLVEELAPAAL
jgi:glycosyltransferase involved in cell wall biosynthesis